MLDKAKLGPRNWNALIEDVVAGTWIDPETGRGAELPFETILLTESTEGAEADLIGALGLGRRLAVVSDVNTADAMGSRVARALRGIASVDEIVLPDGIECDEAMIARVSDLTRHADGVVAVGSGVLNDTCKHATYLDGRPYAVFGTAASMNGYGASTASVTLASGLKTSLPSHAPRGIFLDLKVSAAAPSWLAAAGLGDSLCRPTAQVDWWAAHRLFGSFYSRTPYALQEADEPDMIATAAGLRTGDLDAVGILQRVLTLTSIGVCFTKVSNHGSMGEHQISHWADMFAGEAHPGSVHGQQVGVASLVMARLQHQILALDTPPIVRPTLVDPAAIERRYGPTLAPLIVAEHRKTALDAAGADAFNHRLAEMWPTLKRELAPMLMPVDEMELALAAAGGPLTGEDLGFPVEVWRNAIRHAREIRGRWSFLNLAQDAGLLDAFVETQR
jgi:glycerol-1-phosphate dehydrogenase [NAD(P)+]